MTKILMVCLGNICRSPLAEGILQSKVNPDQVFVDSAGTAGYHVGSTPDPRSIEVARKHGIDISHQRTRQFTAEDFKAFDAIYVMDKSNYRNVIALATSQADREKVALLLGNISGNTSEVPDPYYGGPSGFDHVFDLIDEACEIISNEL